MSIDAVAPTLFTFLAITTDALQEVAKFRAARRVWARLMRDEYGAADPRSQQLRIFAFTAGSTLTAQQPLNNVVRASVEAMAAALAGVQTMHVSAYDEALGVPTEAAATLALRTQQVVAFETGLTETVDPLRRFLRRRVPHRRARGRRSTPCSSRSPSGAARWPASSPAEFARELADAAYEHALAVERGDRVGRRGQPLPGRRRAARGVPHRSRRRAGAGRRRPRGAPDSRRRRPSTRRWRGCAATSRRAARSCRPTIEAVRAYATIGEIVAVLKDELGGWVPTSSF